MVSTSGLQVHGLVCHRDIDMAIVCLGSLLKYSSQPLDLIIHDDGSLTPEDQNKLLNTLNGASLLRRSDADDLMEPLLRNYPHCRHYRSSYVYGLKLLDVALLSHGDFAYCDSDILFVRSFSNLFQWPSPEVSAIFMQDYLNGYSMLPWNLVGSGNLKLTSKVNSGLFLFRKSTYDLDFVEWFLGQKQFRHKVGWLEQSCWAALGTRVGCRQWDPEQVVLMRPWTQLTDQMVAGHFVKEVRPRMKDFVLADNTQQSLSNQPISVETIAVSECSLFDLGRVHAMRQLKRAQNFNRISEIVRQKLALNW